MADIEAMFHQVRVNNEDTDLIRFLWWPDGDYKQELVEYKMLVHLFGATSSPSIATFVLQKCASDHEEEFGHETAETVRRIFYVNDCLKSVKDEGTAITLRTNLINMLAKGGFHLTKWSSNSKKVLNSKGKSPRVAGLGLRQRQLTNRESIGYTVVR